MYENVGFIISQLSIVYIVTKDNKFVTKHQARCWLFYELNNTICSFTAALLAVELAQDWWMT